MEKVVADTGFIVALLNSKDTHHENIVKVYLQQNLILIPQTVLAEVAYLIGRDVGVAALVQFLRGISKSKFEIVGLIDKDLARTAEILEQYQDSRIDFVDATVMAIAENQKIEVILTIDKRDFSLFRPKHCESFILLPE